MKIICQIILLILFLSTSARETVTFTFDDKEMAEQFNTAFRQAIRLCKPK